MRTARLIRRATSVYPGGARKNASEDNENSSFLQVFVKKINLRFKLVHVFTIQTRIRLNLIFAVVTQNVHVYFY
jgi:hypothetical protein